MADETNIVRLEAHLHELAEALQAAVNYFEILRNRIRHAGGDQAPETVILDKLMKQLARAQEESETLSDELRTARNRLRVQ